MSIHVREVSKRFGRHAALDRVSLDVPTGGLVALLGPSGSGKTTLLRIIAGLESPDGGAVWHRDEEITRRHPRDRNVGFVFQHYALFRHMTVFENVAFALRVRRRPTAEVQARVAELLRLVRLEEFGNRYPAQLSGGQRQRIALARALAARPRVLLLDEPFGALDARVRQELRQWLRRLHDELDVTSLFVTHDQEEAFAVADRVVVLNEGRVEQQGAAADVFDRPANAFVMNFLGNVNIFHGRVYVRPHELDIAREPTNGSSVRARVVHIVPTGALARVQLADLDTQDPIHVEVGSERLAELALSAGEQVFLTPRKVRVFAPGDYCI